MQRRRFLKSSLLGSLSLAGLPYLGQAALGQTYEWAGKKILFLGDSITQAGGYINFLESGLLAISGEISSELLNLGLASETISGLSEEAHPFPRPYLHDRLDNILTATQPDIIFACYGINCGIYHPFDEVFFKQYRQGIEMLIDKAKKQQAKLILMTPPPYAAPVSSGEGAREDAGRADYSYAKPYLAYDDVMRKYAEWLLSIKGEVKVVDLQSSMRRYQAICYDDDYIHPNIYGHQLMAVTMLDALGWEKNRPEIELVAEPSAKPEVNSFGQTHTVQMPHLPYRKLTENQQYDQRLAVPEVKLVLPDCPSGTFQLFDQHQLIGQYENENLRKGVVLNRKSFGEKLQNLLPWSVSEIIYRLVADKRKLYDYSLLQHIGHERPMSHEGLPISLATMKRDEIQIQLANLLEPRSWELSLVKVG